MTAPERIWIEDERPEGGTCHVHNEPSEGVLMYGVEYVRADLALPAMAVPEKWIDRATDAVWAELSDSKEQRWKFRREHVRNAIASTFAALRGEGQP